MAGLIGVDGVVGRGGGWVGAYTALQITLLYTCLMRHNRTESPIYVLLSVPCFQRQPFRFLFNLCPDDQCRRLSVNLHVLMPNGLVQKLIILLV